MRLIFQSGLPDPGVLLAVLIIVVFLIAAAFLLGLGMGLTQRQLRDEQVSPRARRPVTDREFKQRADATRQQKTSRQRA
jgi:hypothetical protein